MIVVLARRHRVVPFQRAAEWCTTASSSTAAAPSADAVGWFRLNATLWSGIPLCALPSLCVCMRRPCAGSPPLVRAAVGPGSRRQCQAVCEVTHVRVVHQ